MGLLAKAYETYITFQDLAGKTEEGKSPLIPIGHSIQNVQLEITIDVEGHFVDAKSVDKGAQATIIPVTVESEGSRTNKPCPHPLCDKLEYIFQGKRQEHEMYIGQLREWADSEWATDKVRAIYKYVAAGTLEDDLQTKGVPYKEDNMVRWRVLGSTGKSACWENMELFDSWRKYYVDNMEGEADICMLSGQDDYLADSHPKKIVAAYGNAKIISSNDKTNFTFRGRFCSAKEALTVGYKASQYAHNGLRWLTRNQGVLAGGRVFLCWSPGGHRVPVAWNPFITGNGGEILQPSDYYGSLRQALNGIRMNLHIDDDVVVTSLDAATAGRLSITYYSEFKAEDFLQRLKKWYSSCIWFNGKFGIQAPGIAAIVRCTYGIKHEDKGDGGDNKHILGKFKLSDKLYAEQFQRGVKCVVDSGRLPEDMVRRIASRASKPQCYGGSRDGAYRYMLYVACALIRKYHNDIKGREEWKLELEEHKRDRSYQFGRLLAVMEKVETDTYDENENREANAIRLQTAFSERPWQYTEIIHNKLTPYFARHKQKTRWYFKRLIGEIMEELAVYPDGELNKKLSETYLLGYYLQRNVLYKKHEKVDAEADGNIEGEDIIKKENEQ